MKSFFFLFLIITSTNAFSQFSATCNSPEASQFDFWIGDWELTWNDSMKGENSITKEMNDCVVNEHFYDPKTEYRGLSWSVYHLITGKWQQTWVDNTGDYIHLTGGMEGQRMILTTTDQKNAKGIVRHQMQFYNISKNSFDWNWEASIDQGKTWSLKWKIHYERKEDMEEK